MLDTKSRLVLSILYQEAKNGNYKIFELQDIIMSLPKRYRMETQTVRNILNHLERQDIISIKYDDEDKFCLCILPFGFEIIENEKPSKITYKEKKQSNSINYPLLSIICFLSSFLAVLLCFFLFK